MVSKERRRVEGRSVSKASPNLSGGVDENRYGELVSALKINKFELDTELERQPSLYLEAAEEAVRARSLLDQAKLYLDNLEAALDKDFRRLAARGDEKITEKSLNAEIQRDKRRQEAYAAMLEFKAYADRLEHLTQAFRSRGQVVRDLSSLYVAGYFQDERFVAGKLGEVREKRAQYNSDRMAEKRRSRGGGAL